MKWLVILLLFSIPWPNQQEGRLNLAKEAYERGDFLNSIHFYRLAIKDYPGETSLINYNLAQCMLRIDSVEMALQYFHLALNPLEPKVSSMAQNNIGIILLQRNKKEEALMAFRSALVRDEQNEYARFNYELLKRRMPPPEAPPAPPPNQAPPPPPEEKKEEPEAGPPPELPKEFQELIQRIRSRLSRNIATDDKARPIDDSLSVEQAKQLLDHLSKEEIQFIQQLKKTWSLGSRSNRNRPDW